jgi:hypothetical protein
MSERITIEKEEDKLAITILAFNDAKKQQMLMMWIVLFSLCGLAIISQFFAPYDNGTKVFFGVYIAFWLFFEFKVVYAYRWRKFGLEYLTIEDGELILSKQIGKRGITQRFKISDIQNLRIFENADTNFVKSMTSSYWNINKYTLAFDYNNQIIPFGIDLSKKEANRILKTLQEFSKNL